MKAASQISPTGSHPVLSFPEPTGDAFAQAHVCSMCVCLSSHMVPEGGEAVIVNPGQQRGETVISSLTLAPGIATKNRACGVFSRCWEDGTVSGLICVFRRVSCLRDWLYLRT